MAQRPRSAHRVGSDSLSQPKESRAGGSGNEAQILIFVAIHQGSALSPLLFVVVVEAVKADLQRLTPWKLLYADDVTPVSENKGDLKRQKQAWSDHLARFSFRLIVEKTEYMMNKVNEPSRCRLMATTSRGPNSSSSHLAHEIIALTTLRGSSDAQ